MNITSGPTYFLGFVAFFAVIAFGGSVVAFLETKDPLHRLGYCTMFVVLGLLFGSTWFMWVPLIALVGIVYGIAKLVAK